MQEIWKPIKDYEGLYEVSNLGKVRSLPMIRKDGRVLGKNFKRNRAVVCLSKDGKLSTKMLYRLVAQHFPEICGEWFDECEVHHKDYNTLNDNADNLQVLTKKEHIKIHQESEITQERNRDAAFKRWQKRK